MKLQKRSLHGALLASVALLGAVSGTAKADVLWQHNGTVSVGGEKLGSFQMFNAWSADKHKTTVNFDATPLVQFGASGAGMAKGTVALIERLDDDKLIAYSPQIPSYIEEPYSTLKPRLRFNLWEGIDDELAKDSENAAEIPQLTKAQRQRLGREMRASMSLLTRSISRVYFRALPNKRTINGLESQGYRFTSMVNVGTGGRQEWVRASAELWMAAPVDGDSEIAAFTKRANDLKKASGPLTVSMWSNETLPILWEAMPPELHSFVEALIGRVENEDFGFIGTPVQFFVTLSPPPAQKMMIGDVRFALELKKREVAPLRIGTFEVPEGFKRQPIEPALQIMRNAQKQSVRIFEQIMKGQFGPSMSSEF